MNITEFQRQKILPRMPVWSEVTAQSPPALGLASGHRALDTALGGSGWPQESLTEILIGRVGIDEVNLLLPAFAQITRQKRWLALVAPPRFSSALGLAHAGVDLARVLLIHPSAGQTALRTVEQMLRAGTCGAVLAWVEQADYAALRRLQLAAEAGNSRAVLFRPVNAMHLLSPAGLRLKLEPFGASGRTLAVQVLKCQGRASSARVVVNLGETAHHYVDNTVAS